MPIRQLPPPHTLGSNSSSTKSPIHRPPPPQTLSSNSSSSESSDSSSSSSGSVSLNEAIAKRTNLEPSDDLDISDEDEGIDLTKSFDMYVRIRIDIKKSRLPKPLFNGDFFYRRAFISLYSLYT